MTHIKLFILALGLLAFIASTAGCNTLALTGHKKYQVDLSNLLLQIRKQIEEQGKITPKLLNKYDMFLSRHNEAYALKGSHIRASEALAELKLGANATEEIRYQHNLTAKLLMSQSQDLLTTEAKGG